MDRISFKCRSCSGKLAVESAYAGRNVECPSCRTSLIIPSDTRSNGGLVKTRSGMKEENFVPFTGGEAVSVRTGKKKKGRISNAIEKIFTGIIWMVVGAVFLTLMNGQWYLWTPVLIGLIQVLTGFVRGFKEGF